MSKSFFALPIFLLLVCGCDVPRDNPNDPYGTTFPVSPPEPAGEIDVSVYSEHVNRLGADADYYWFNIDALITGFCPIDSTNAVLLDNSYPLTLIWGGDNSCLETESARRLPSLWERRSVDRP